MTSGKAPGTLLFFWDFDAQWGGDRSRSPGGPKHWGHLDFEHVEQLLELHARFEIPACFAVVGAVALPGSRPYHDPSLIRRIHDAGHEIASHSLRHDWLPGLGRRQLLESVRDSKDALEQCIGARVVSFVPPYNQPFDYAAGFSFSRSERQAGPERKSLGELCEALRESGYLFCRVAYRPMHVRIAEALLRTRIDRPGQTEQIKGLTCIRLNSPGGFEERSIQLLSECARRGGMAVIWGHPHSLHSGNSQDLRHLLPFLKVAAELREAGTIVARHPRDLLSEYRPMPGIAEHAHPY